MDDRYAVSAEGDMDTLSVLPTPGTAATDAWYCRYQYLVLPTSAEAVCPVECDLPDGSRQAKAMKGEEGQNGPPDDKNGPGVRGGEGRRKASVRGL